MTRGSPSPSPVVVGIAVLALGVGAVTLWSAVTVTAYVLGPQALAALALVLLACGLGAFALVRARKTGRRRPAAWRGAARANAGPHQRGS